MPPRYWNFLCACMSATCLNLRCFYFNKVSCSSIYPYLFIPPSNISLKFCDFPVGNMSGSAGLVLSIHFPIAAPSPTDSQTLLVLHMMAHHQRWEKSSTNQRSHPAGDCVWEEILIQVTLFLILPILAGIFKHYCLGLYNTATRLSHLVKVSQCCKASQQKYCHENAGTRAKRCKAKYSEVATYFAYGQKFILNTNFWKTEHWLVQ